MDTYQICIRAQFDTYQIHFLINRKKKAERKTLKTWCTEHSVALDTRARTYACGTPLSIIPKTNFQDKQKKRYAIILSPMVIANVTICSTLGVGKGVLPGPFSSSVRKTLSKWGFRPPRRHPPQLLSAAPPPPPQRTHPLDFLIEVSLRTPQTPRPLLTSA